MTDLGPFDDDVPFAWHAASGLKHSFLRAADELETQIGQRTSYGQEVKRIGAAGMRRSSRAST
jgi:hypothetical protein